LISTKRVLANALLVAQGIYAKTGSQRRICASANPFLGLSPALRLGRVGVGLIT